MPNEDVRIGLCGLGSIGKHVGRLLLDHRRGFEIVGAATKETEAIELPLGATSILTRQSFAFA